VESRNAKFLENDHISGNDQFDDHMKIFSNVQLDDILSTSVNIDNSIIGIP
jgi:hypothetical protein